MWCQGSARAASRSPLRLDPPRRTGGARSTTIGVPSPRFAMTGRGRSLSLGKCFHPNPIPELTNPQANRHRSGIPRITVRRAPKRDRSSRAKSSRAWPTRRISMHRSLSTGPVGFAPCRELMLMLVVALLVATLVLLVDSARSENRSSDPFPSLRSATVETPSRTG